MLISQQWPKIIDHKKAEADEFEDVKEIVSLFRRWSRAIGSSSFAYKDSSFLDSNKSLIKLLARIKKFDGPSEPSGLRLPMKKYDLYISATKDMGLKFIENNEKEKKIIEEFLKTLKLRLNNSDYVKNAPKELIDESHHRFKEQTEKLALIDEELRVVLDWVKR